MKKIVFIFLLLFSLQAEAQTDLVSGKVFPWSVSSGGTGLSALTQYYTLIGNGTSAPTLLAPGTSGYVLTSNGASANPSWQAGSLPKTYAVTIADATNTASEIDIISATVPANDFNDGDELQFFWTTESLQNSGGAVTITIKVYWNGNSVTINSAVSVANNATMGQATRVLYMRRVGTSVYISIGQPGSVNINTDSYIASAALTSGGGLLTSQTFSGSAVAKMTVQWASANAFTYYKVKSARSIKFSQ